MKRLLAITLSLLLLVGSVASVSAEASAKKLNIVTTIFPQYDFSRQIVGDLADVTMLLKPGAESHSYEPSPQDIKLIQNSDVFIITGGENDVWVDEILESMGDQKPLTLRLVDMVDTVNEVIVEGMEHEHHHDHDHEHEHAEEADHDHDHEHEHAEEADHDHEHEHAEDADHDHEHEHAEDADHDHEHEHAEEADHNHDHEHEHAEEADHDHEHEHAEEADHDHEHEHEDEVDEHVWTSPVNAMEIVRQLTALYSAKDPANAEAYAKNSEAYLAKLTKLDASFREVVASAKRDTLMFGDRFPFRYLADAYGLKYYAAFTGCSTETEASAATVAFLIDKTKEMQLPVVFSIELSNGKIADSVSEASGSKRLTLYSCHNVTADQMAAGVTYLSMMQENVESLKTALN